MGFPGTYCATLRKPRRNHWNRLCGSIRATLGPKARWKPEELRSKLVETLASAPEILEEQSRVATLCRQLSACLTDFEDPLSPRQKRLLGQAEKALLRLISQIPDALAILHREGLDSDWMEDYMETGTAEHLFDRGLDAWEAGRWDEARMKWHAGLELDPDHVDLHVHAGLAEEMEENWSLALLHYEKAIDLGKPFVDSLIEKDPDFYVTSEAKKRLVETLTSCEAPDEHPPPHDRPCEDCIENLGGRIGSFRGHMEVRPFLRALYNRALLLKRLGRHQEAIETLEVRCRYQDDPNSRTLQAECHLLLGNLDRAEQLYWALGPGSSYVYSLILLKRGKREVAMDWLLKAVFWNPYMGELLLGRREPESVRWKGTVLPRDKEASEFWYEYEHYFKGESLWRNWLGLVLDDDRIREVRETLEEAIQSRETDRQYRMDPLNWGLCTGSPDVRFLEEHRERLLQRARRPRKPRVSGTRSWMPEVGC